MFLRSIDCHKPHTILTHMDFIQIYKRILFPLLATMFLAVSCQDEAMQHPDYTIVGKEVQVTIPLSVPEMTIQTRSSLGVDQLTQVQSLMVAVFNSTTEEITSKKDDGTYGWVEVKNPAPSNSGYEQLHPITLTALSGPSYIVAVANVDNEGVKQGAMTARPLRDLLEESTTWSEFLKIAAVTPSTFDQINAPSSPMVMSGCYTGVALGGTHPSDWQSTNFTAVTIPYDASGKVALNPDAGAIHLRRLMSHVTFNVKPGPPSTMVENPVVDIDVLSYRVVNAPSYSWLYERGSVSKGAPANKPNYGDNAENEDDAKDYQGEIIFPTQYIKDIDGGQSFDFWQSENKHTGIITTSENPSDAQKFNEYNLREGKYGTVSDGTVTYLDPPLFTSLCGGGIWTTNNMASYVVMTCEVKYKDSMSVDGDGKEVQSGGSTVYRSGIAEYIVHLGYLNNVVNDFNCYRNTDYTYNVTVTGLNDILVEAIGGSERNAAEGTVIDAENPTVMLDAHYAAFNIVLTRDEISGEAAEDFGFIMTTYENGNATTVFSESIDNTLDEKYYDWIEIKRTNGAERLARYYPPKGNLPTGASESVRVMSIKDFVDKIHNGTLESEIEDLNYFTVFVNENTYEPRYGEVDYGNESNTSSTNKVRWPSYVNQNPRRFYIRVRRRTSSDKNSIYVRSKYSVQQQSIQTFYSTTSLNDSENAFGLEHINETQGLNLRRSFSPTAVSDLDGRYNVKQWVISQTVQSLWSNVISQSTIDEIDYNTPQNIPSVSNLQNGPDILSLISGRNPALTVDQSELGYTHLPQTAQYRGNISISNYDPQPNSTRNNYIEAINACMNRNRDENGDGIINDVELKWYVPTSGKYLRSILGRASLLSPIMPYSEVKSLPNSSNNFNSRYLVYSSNNVVVWAMEGLSSSNWNGSFTNESMQPPWQVRCIRNLGTNLGGGSINSPNVEQVEKAYSHDEANNRFIMADYDRRSVRTTKYTGKGNSGNDNSMPPHVVTSDINRVYQAFEYSETGFIPTTVFSFNDTNNSKIPIYSYIIGSENYCANLTGEGWRLPNQKELAIMRNEGLFPSNPDNKFTYTVNNNTRTAEYSLTCTYSYFDNNISTPQPYNAQTNPFTGYNFNFIGAKPNGNTQLSLSNMTYGNEQRRNLYIRCVRDVDI